MRERMINVNKVSNSRVLAPVLVTVLEGIQTKGVPRLCQDPLAEPLKRPNRIGSISYPAYLSTGVPAWIVTLPNDKNTKPIS